MIGSMLVLVTLRFNSLIRLGGWKSRSSLLCLYFRCVWLYLWLTCIHTAYSVAQVKSDHAMPSPDTWHWYFLLLIRPPKKEKKNKKTFRVFKNTCICCLRCSVALNVPQCTSSYITPRCRAAHRLAFSPVSLSGSFVASQRIVSSVRDWLPTTTAVCLSVCLSACLPACLPAWQLWPADLLNSTLEQKHQQAPLLPSLKSTITSHLILWITVIFTFEKYMSLNSSRHIKQISEKVSSNPPDAFNLSDMTQGA